MTIITEKRYANANCNKKKATVLDHPQMGSYLAGLWEGDGHITLPSYCEQGKLKNTPCLAITFTENDLPLVKLLVDTFGGWVRFKKQEHALVWAVTKHSELQSVVTLLNGNLRSPKIQEFNQLISYLNVKLANPNLSLFGPDLTPLGNNYWLAGFIDAEGHFKIRYTDKKVDASSGKVFTKQRIGLAFVLEQQKFHPKNQLPFEPLLKEISDLLLVKLAIRKHNQGKEYWCIELTSLNKMEILVNYLVKYPLLTSKVNNFKDWLRAYHLTKTNTHLTDTGKSAILMLKSGMNKKRTVFDWSHLDCPH